MEHRHAAARSAELHGRLHRGGARRPFRHPLRTIAGCGKTLLSFRGGPSGPSPEPRNTGQAFDFWSRRAWIPARGQSPRPGMTSFPAFFRILLVDKIGRLVLSKIAEVECGDRQNGGFA